MVICLERGADLHIIIIIIKGIYIAQVRKGHKCAMAQLMLLQLTVSCFSKIQIGITFLVPAYSGSPGQRAVKRVCVGGVVLNYCLQCFDAVG